TDWRMDMRGVAREENSSLPIGRCLTRHVGEARDPVRTVNAVVGPAHGNEQLLELAERGLVTPTNLRLSEHHADRSDILVDDLAVLDLEFSFAEGMSTCSSPMDA